MLPPVREAICWKQNRAWTSFNDLAKLCLVQDFFFSVHLQYMQQIIKTLKEIKKVPRSIGGEGSLIDPPSDQPAAAVGFFEARYLNRGK